MWQAAVLGIIQGLTEFLPVSSSGHLLILEKLTPLPDFGLGFDAFLHLGTLLAVLIYFRSDIWRIILGLFRPQDRENRRLLWLIVIGILPAGIIGYFSESVIGNELRLPLLVVFNLIFWGLIMGWADWYISRRGPVRTKLTELRWQDSLVIGLAQVLSLLPGTSRSGITITAGLFRSISRETAARFSFIMSSPLIAAAGLLSLKDMGGSSEAIAPLVLVIGFMCSLVSGWLAIHLLLQLLVRSNLWSFVWYRVILGLVLLYFIL